MAEIRFKQRTSCFTSQGLSHYAIAAVRSGRERSKGSMGRLTFSPQVFLPIPEADKFRLEKCSGAGGELTSVTFPAILKELTGSRLNLSQPSWSSGCFSTSWTALAPLVCLVCTQVWTKRKETIGNPKTCATVPLLGTCGEGLFFLQPICNCKNACLLAGCWHLVQCATRCPAWDA